MIKKVFNDVLCKNMPEGALMVASADHLIYAIFVLLLMWKTSLKYALEQSARLLYNQKTLYFRDNSSLLSLELSKMAAR